MCSPIRQRKNSSTINFNRWAFAQFETAEQHQARRKGKTYYFASRPTSSALPFRASLYESKEVLVMIDKIPT